MLFLDSFIKSSKLSPIVSISQLYWKMLIINADNLLSSVAIKSSILIPSLWQYATQFNIVSFLSWYKKVNVSKRLSPEEIFL